MSTATKIRPIEGKYKLLGRKLLPEASDAIHHFIVGQRETQTLKKASKYLVLFFPGGKEYFSSLYPLERQEGVYDAEHKGMVYRIEFGQTSVIIKVVGHV